MNNQAKPFQPLYSGHRFDAAQQMAFELTDADRKAGRPAPDAGYSEANWKIAEAFFKA